MSTLIDLSSSEPEAALVEDKKERSSETSPQAIEGVRKLADIILIGLFGLVLFLPLADMLFDVDPTPSIRENRPLARLPIQNQMTFNTFPKQFETYFNDHFGFRQTLIQGRSIFLTFFLRISPNPLVILGKDDWLFYASNDLEYYQANDLFTPLQLKNAQGLLEQDYATWKRCNIYYMAIIAPNKSTIYPEYMPDTIIRANEQSRLDQLVTYLQAHSTLDLIDLRPALKQAKVTDLLYDPTGTHWNEVGAFVAYQQIVPRLQQWFPQIQPMARADFEVIEKAQATELLQVAGLQNVWQENVRVIKPHRPFTAQEAKIDLVVEISKIPGPQRPFALETNDVTLPNVVVIHDSFFKTGRLYQFIAEHFHRAAFYHYGYIHQFDDLRRIIEHEQPDLVIYEVVERSLQSGVGVLSPDFKTDKNSVCR